MTKEIKREDIKVTYRLEIDNEVMETEVKELVEKNLEGKMTSAFKKIAANHPDTDLELIVNIEKNEQTKYEGNFHLKYSGMTESYHNDKPFKILSDLVNHAFQTIKGHILEK